MPAADVWPLSVASSVAGGLQKEIVFKNVEHI